MTAAWRLLSSVLALGGCVSTSPPLDEAREGRVARDPAALTRIGEAALQSGDAAAASGFFGRASRLAPGDADAAMGEASALTEQGRIADAIDALGRTLHEARGEGRVRMSSALGRLLVMDHRPDEAVEAFRSGLAVAPDDAGLLIGQGIAMDARRDHAGAQASYRRALATEPGSVAAANDLALSEAIGGDAEAAVVGLERLRSVAAPGSADLATIDGNLALAHAMRGEMAEARSVGDRIVGPATDAARNASFYSALAPDRGASDSSGLIGGTPAD